MVKKDPANTGPVELADLFSRHARRRVKDRFHQIFRNEDVRTYATARKVLDDAYLWLEEGMVRSKD